MGDSVKGKGIALHTAEQGFVTSECRAKRVNAEHRLVCSTNQKQTSKDKNKTKLEEFGNIDDKREITAFRKGKIVIFDIDCQSYVREKQK